MIIVTLRKVFLPAGICALLLSILLHVLLLELDHVRGMLVKLGSDNSASQWLVEVAESG